MADSEDPSCPISGNSDLYGLGVRLGLYLQFIALVLARPAAKRAFDAINTSTIAFILANFIVLLQQSSSRELYAPEAYLLFYLLVPQLAVNIVGTDLKADKLDYRGVIAILLWGAFSFYYVWFWWVGLDVLQRSNCDDEFGFFFTRVSLRGWFRTFNKVIWTMAATVFGVSILVLFAKRVYNNLFIPYLGRKIGEQEEQEANLDQPPISPMATPSEDTENRENIPQGRTPHSEAGIAMDMIQHLVVQFRSLLPFAVFVSGAEVTLRYNNIQDVNTVNSASQLVPLVLALGLLVHVISPMLVKFSHGFRHAFDEDAEEHTDDDRHNSTRDEVRQGLREERGWLGAIGRFLFRVYCAFVVGYNHAEGEEEPSQSGSVTGCPKSGQYSAVDVELQSGTRP